MSGLLLLLCAGSLFFVGGRALSDALTASSDLLLRVAAVVLVAVCFWVGLVVLQAALAAL